MYRKAIRDLRLYIKNLILVRIENLKKNEYCSNDMLFFVLDKLSNQNLNEKICF